MFYLEDIDTDKYIYKRKFTVKYRLQKNNRHAFLCIHLVLIFFARVTTFVTIKPTAYNVVIIVVEYMLMLFLYIQV